MRTISIRMPDSLHRQIRAMAIRDGVTFNQAVVLALAEKMFAVMSEESRAMRMAEEADERAAGESVSEDATSPARSPR